MKLQLKYQGQLYDKCGMLELYKKRGVFLSDEYFESWIKEILETGEIVFQKDPTLAEVKRYKKKILTKKCERELSYKLRKKNPFRRKSEREYWQYLESEDFRNRVDQKVRNEFGQITDWNENFEKYLQECKEDLMIDFLNITPYIKNFNQKLWDDFDFDSKREDCKKALIKDVQELFDDWLQESEIKLPPWGRDWNDRDLCFLSSENIPWLFKDPGEVINSVGYDIFVFESDGDDYSFAAYILEFLQKRYELLSYFYWNMDGELEAEVEKIMYSLEETVMENLDLSADHILQCLLQNPSHKKLASWMIQHQKN